MSDETVVAPMPDHVAAIVTRGYASWAIEDVSPALRKHFPDERIRVAGVRHVRVWGIQVDDERELPGLERTQIPDEDLWEINLVASNGSKYEVDSKLLRPAPD